MSVRGVHCMRKIVFLILLSIIVVIALIAYNNRKPEPITVGGSIVATIRAEVVEIVSERALYVKVIEPAQFPDTGYNSLLPGVFVTVTYDENFAWVINSRVEIGSTIELVRGITLGSVDFLQEPFEVRPMSIRVVLNEDD